MNCYGTSDVPKLLSIPSGITNDFQASENNVVNDIRGFWRRFYQYRHRKIRELEKPTNVARAESGAVLVRAHNACQSIKVFIAIRHKILRCLLSDAHICIKDIRSYIAI